MNPDALQRFKNQVSQMHGVKFSYGVHCSKEMFSVNFSVNIGVIRVRRHAN